MKGSDSDKPPTSVELMFSGIIQRTNLFGQLFRKIKGAPRDFSSADVAKEITVGAFLAWVGLGADALSSCVYGPDESFRSLVGQGDHAYLGVGLALATAVMVLVLSYTYNRVVEEFPHGGGGYVVATTLLGRGAGLVSGCALLVDYVLTISTSVATGAHLLVTIVPEQWKIPPLLLGTATILLMTFLNVRGIRESVKPLIPVFVVFLVTHVILLVGGAVERALSTDAVVSGLREGFARDRSELGLLGIAIVFARAFALGGGTYTGIEAVSNGLGVMREPKIPTARRTMTYLWTSLVFTASGILLLYALAGIHPTDANTPLSAVLIKKVTADWPLGKGFGTATIASEVLLLFVAAQTGFIGGPRVMASMALDRWLPVRFAALSDRLAMQNGVFMIGVGAGFLLWYAQASVDTLVVLFAINVFVTFLLTSAGMLRLVVGRTYRMLPGWWRKAAVLATSVVLCSVVLVLTIWEKFFQGAWLTLVVTTLLCFLCAAIRRRYLRVSDWVAGLETGLESNPRLEALDSALHGPRTPTAVLILGGYKGLGMHTYTTVKKMFPDLYKRFVFLSIGVVDSNVLKGGHEMAELNQYTAEELDKYVKLARETGVAAESRMGLASDVPEEVTQLCRKLKKEFPGAHFFTGKLIFENERWYDRLLHTDAVNAIQDRLQLAGIPAIVLPVRLRAKRRA
jgi:amino acid transporter